MTERLFAHLHGGGVYAHLWTDAGNRSYWFRVDGRTHEKRRTVPKSWLAHNVYFTVHPLARIPPQNGSGNRDPRFICSQLPYITAVNTLFAEYDGKDFVAPAEYRRYLPLDLASIPPVELRIAIKGAQEQIFYAEPDRYKQRARAVIQSLYFPPSVIVDSGGGYHTYWLLRETVPVDDTNRADIQAIQHAWVHMMHADPGASDLRRMLRVPGTYNMKPGFGDHHPKVSFVKADFGLLYTYSELDEAVNDWIFGNRPQRATNSPRLKKSQPADDEERTTFNQKHSLVDLLIEHGYQLSFRSKAMTRLARPGRTKSYSSVTVFPAREDGTPELSVHFSSNDPLYCHEYLDPTGQVRRHAHDAYAVNQMLQAE
jgi:hypothetical protein